MAENYKRAVFAAGCFWCIEKPFDHLDGVKSTVAGYTGGHTQSPTYGEVSAGGSGHIEAIEVTYDSTQISYETLLDTFWHNVDPLDAGGQFCDRGDQYRSAIFVDDEKEEILATQSKADISKRLNAQVATDIIAAGPFYRAEEYHQDYYKKNPIRYRYYRYRCGRDQRLEEVWGPQILESHSE